MKEEKKKFRLLYIFTRHQKLRTYHCRHNRCRWSVQTILTRIRAWKTSQTPLRLAPSSQVSLPALSGSKTPQALTHSSAYETCCLHAARQSVVDAASNACAHKDRTCCTRSCPGSAWTASRKAAQWYGSYGNAGGDTESPVDVGAGFLGDERAWKQPARATHRPVAHLCV